MVLDPNVLEEASRVELALNALSARANVIANASCILGDLDRSLAEVLQLCARVEKLCEGKQSRHWRSFQTARAVAHTACARIYMLRGGEGDAEKARSELHTALAAAPTFGGALIHLGKLYIMYRHRLRSDWLSLADSHLKRAAQLMPECRYVTSLRAKLMLCDASRRGDAARIFRDLGSLPEASQWLATFLMTRLPEPRKHCPTLHMVQERMAICSSMESAVVDRVERVVRRARAAEFEETEAVAQLLDAIPVDGFQLAGPLIDAARAELGALSPQRDRAADAVRAGRP
jgi:hypothetical protein